MSARQSRKEVLTLTTWNSTMPISIATWIKLIEDIEPILNCTLTIPLIDLFNYTLLIF